MRVIQHRASFPVSTDLISLCPVTSVCGVFSNRIITWGSGGQPHSDQLYPAFSVTFPLPCGASWLCFRTACKYFPNIQAFSQMLLPEKHRLRQLPCLTPCVSHSFSIAVVWKLSFSNLSLTIFRLLKNRSYVLVRRLFFCVFPWCFFQSLGCVPLKKKSNLQLDSSLKFVDLSLPLG